MPLLRAEAEKLTLPDLEMGIVTEIIDRDAVFAMLPFVKTEGKSYDYRRELTLGAAGFIDVNEDVPEGAATFEEVTTRLKILIGDVHIDKFLKETQSNLQSQVATQLAAKAKAVRREFQNYLVNGDTATDAKGFDGIKKLTPAGQVMTADTNGAPITLDMLDALADKVPLGVDAYIAAPSVIRAIKALQRASGGTTPEHQQLSNLTGRSVMVHDGVPILQNDFMPKDEVQGSNSTTTSVYAVRFNESDGLHGLWGGRNLGISYENLGTLEKRDAESHRMKWYCGLALKSTKSLARLKGITNV